MKTLERALYVAIIAVLGVAIWSMKSSNAKLADQAGAKAEVASSEGAQ